ncbi:MAG: hydroxyacid dehydrogenase [Bacteroidales bacterium]|nr:hydroxyacid dehydrogenase [Bacteroidales bacterium]
MKKRQILILEELGISKDDFNKLTLSHKLDFEFIWDIEKVSPDMVEGIITIKTKVDINMTKSYINLKFVAVAFTGYDCVDMESCRKNNIAVFNVPTYSTDSVAELTLGLAISLLREIPSTQHLVRNGKWNHKAGMELKGKTVGIIGSGNIGIRVAELFAAFGCNILAWSRTERKEFIEIGGKYVNSLNKLANQVDILSIHIPQTPETINLIDESILSSMKNTSYLINCARGPIVNQKDLSHALNNKLIAGAAIDVFDLEPISPKAEILSAKNTIITPHIAYKTEEALLRRAAITFDNIHSFIIGRNSNRVN